MAEFTNEELLKEVKRRNLQVEAALEFVPLSQLIEAVKTRLESYILIIKPKEDQKLHWTTRMSYYGEYGWMAFELMLVQHEIVKESGRGDNAEGWTDPDGKPEGDQDNTNEDGDKL